MHNAIIKFSNKIISLLYCNLISLTFPLVQNIARSQDSKYFQYYGAHKSSSMFVKKKLQTFDIISFDHPENSNS